MGDLPAWSVTHGGGGDGGGGVSVEDLATAINTVNTAQNSETGARQAADFALDSRVTDLESTAVTSDDVTTIAVLSQADYDALDPPDAATLYVIRG